MTDIPATPMDAMLVATRTMSGAVVQGLSMLSATLRAGEPEPQPVTPFDLAQAWWQGPVAFANAFTAGMMKPSFGVPTLPFTPPIPRGAFNFFSAPVNPMIAMMQPFADAMAASTTALAPTSALAPARAEPAGLTAAAPAGTTAHSAALRFAGYVAPAASDATDRPFAAYQSSGGHATAQIIAPISEFVASTTRAAVDAQAALLPLVAPWLQPAKRAAAR